MSASRFVIIVVIMASSSGWAARLPTSSEAQQCVIKADKDLFAGMWNKLAHLCSEFFSLEKVEVTDISRAANMADVMISLQYRVLMPSTSASADGRLMSANPSTVQLCTGATVSGVVLPGTILLRKDRKVSMQEWATGWKCKE